MVRCPNCLAPLRLDAGRMATCLYCGVQTWLDAPGTVAPGAPVASGRRLAEEVAFVVPPSLKIPFLSRDAALPIHRTETLSTSRDDQDKLDVHLVQGDHPVARFDFPLRQRVPRGVAKISLTVRVAATGAFSLTLSEQGTDNVLDRDGLSVVTAG